MNFKVGQKVRIIGNSNSSCNKIGDIGIIVEEVENKLLHRVEVPDRGSRGNWTRLCDMTSLIPVLNTKVKVL